jgi:hypothetical protein
MNQVVGAIVSEEILRPIWSAKSGTKVTVKVSGANFRSLFPESYIRALRFVQQAIKNDLRMRASKSGQKVTGERHIDA